MPTSRIKSKPSYAPLALDPEGTGHLLVGQGRGAEALARLCQALAPPRPRISILYTRESPSATDLGSLLDGLAIDNMIVVESVAHLIDALVATLARSGMGTRLYAAGAEAFLGQVAAVAREFGMGNAEIQLECLESRERRVYCVHCKTINAHVAAPLAVCAGCGRTVLVRDHFSRRLAAFLGVMADAECGKRSVHEGRRAMTNSDTIPVVVTEIESVAAAVKRFRLSARDGALLPAFSGGSHVVVTMRAGERTRRNPYSLIGPPGERTSYQIAVRRIEASRGGSAFLHDVARVGTPLEIAFPSNLFPLAKHARKHVLIAGGIGITPFLAHLVELRAQGAAYELHYAAKDREHAAFVDRLFTENPGRVHLYLSRSGQRFDPAPVLAGQPLGTHVYVCGPSAMIVDVVASAHRARGWPAASIHRESFAAAHGGCAFTAILARSGRSVHVPEDLSLLEALEGEDIHPPYLCRGGVCGRCETGVLDGEVEHADHFLNAAVKDAHRRIMLCVSRARGERIVLDL